MKKILLILLALVAILAIVIQTRPGEFTVTRSAVIPAPPAEVFPHVNNLHLWNEWSPWAKLDPNATNTFAGPDEGKGASMSWAGNNEVGEGTMTITESQPSEKVGFDLEFRKPMAGASQVEFTFAPEGEQTKVTWTMAGKNNFVGKAFGLLMDCEKMCGDQFEQGFKNLEEVVKGGAK